MIQACLHGLGWARAGKGQAIPTNTNRRHLDLGSASTRNLMIWGEEGGWGEGVGLDIKRNTFGIKSCFTRYPITTATAARRLAHLRRCGHRLVFFLSGVFLMNSLESQALGFSKCIHLVVSLVKIFINQTIKLKTASFPHAYENSIFA